MFDFELSATNLLSFVSWLLVASVLLSIAVVLIKQISHSRKRDVNESQNGKNKRKGTPWKRYYCLFSTGIMIFLFHVGWIMLDFDVTNAWIWLLTMVEFQLVFIILSPPQAPDTTYKHYNNKNKNNITKRASIMAKIRVFVYVGIITISLFYWYFVIIIISFLPYLSNDFQILYNNDQAQDSSLMQNLFYLNSLFSFYSLIDNIVNFKIGKNISGICCNIFLFCSLIINLYGSYSVQSYVLLMFHIIILFSFIIIVVGTFLGWFDNIKKQAARAQGQGQTTNTTDNGDIWKRASATVIGASGVGKTRFLRALISQRYVFGVCCFLLFVVVVFKKCL